MCLLIAVHRAKTATQAEHREKARAARTGPGHVGTRLRREMLAGRHRSPP